MDRNCETCKFSIRYIDGSNKTLYYECRYNPPSVSYTLEQGYMYGIHTQFPRMETTMDNGAWCYKYRKP